MTCHHPPIVIIIIIVVVIVIALKDSVDAFVVALSVCDPRGIGSGLEKWVAIVFAEEDGLDSGRCRNADYAAQPGHVACRAA